MRECQIVEHHGELVIRTRLIPRARGVVLTLVLAVFWTLMILVSDHKLAMIVIALLTGYLGLALALDWNCLAAGPDQLRSWVGPIPLGLPAFVRSSTPAPSDIKEIFCECVRGSAGRGGRFERHVIMAVTRNGWKPVALFDAGEQQGDAADAAKRLVSWLNAHRDKALGAVVLR